MEKLLTPNEVADLLGCTVDDLKNWRRPHILAGGEANPRWLPSIKVDGLHGYRHDDLLAFLRRPENGRFRDALVASLAPADTLDRIVAALRGLPYTPPPVPPLGAYIPTDDDRQAGLGWFPSNTPCTPHTQGEPA